MDEIVNRLPAVHPGEILREEVIRPLGLSAHKLAQELRVPATRINEILHGRRAVSADTALRLARYLGTSAQFWMSLQASYDLKVAEKTHGTKIRREVPARAP
ncbi:MAG: HigA family addiction module antidote protein [Planctomycetes bacterium]|nr:HigA family addiction module antidote protein [Planctomycetota bacterium]